MIVRHGVYCTCVGGVVKVDAVTRVDGGYFVPPAPILTPLQGVYIPWLHQAWATTGVVDHSMPSRARGIGVTAVIFLS